MQRYDTHDQFLDICRKFKEYPKQQLKPRNAQDAFYVNLQWHALQDKENLLFDGSQSDLNFWETAGRHNRFPQQTIPVSTHQDLQHHLHRAEKDPYVRHLFMTSEGSRAAINCSMDMFKIVCSYHQIDPSFLESVCTFGECDQPIDLCLAQFREKDTLKCHPQQRLELPNLGRSGREIRLSYLLRSVEYSEDGPQGVWGWQIRQVANYHSFDVESGRAFWLTIKGNELFQDRIQEVSPFIEIPLKAEVDEGDVSPYIKATLATHIVYLSWCDENWRQFINEVEEDIRAIVSPANGVLLDDHADPSSTYPRSLREMSRRSTMLYSKSHSRSSTMATGATDPKSPILSKVLNATTSTLNSWLRREKTPQVDPEKAMPQQDNASQPIGNPLPRDKQDMLSRFRFKDMQTLHRQTDFLQKAILVLDLNVGVLRDISAYYRSLITTEFSENMSCKEAIEDFLKEVSSILRRLETRSRQMHCLLSTLSQNMLLYERVLQQRTNHISEEFAEISRENNEKMQDISDKTARQTTSMHVITIATLLFLPATFVATFFQSGILLWNEADPEEIIGPFKWQERNFILFVEICVPLTFLTIGSWLYMFIRLRKSTTCMALEGNPLERNPLDLGAEHERPMV